MTALVVAGSGLFGLMIGSFLNVVIHRVPRHQSVVAPGSRCPGCKTPIRGRDNVPVASWVLLRGRCRHCGRAIPARYPLVEAGTGLLFAALALRLDVSWVLPVYAVCFASLLGVSVIDLDHGLLPTRTVSSILAFSGALLVVPALVEHRWGELGHAVVGAVAAGASFGLLRLAYPAGVGRGDVRVSLVVGAVLGFLSLMHVVVGITAAALLRAATGWVLRATGRRDGRDRVPFAPFLALGALATVLFDTAFVG